MLSSLSLSLSKSIRIERIGCVISRPAVMECPDTSETARVAAATVASARATRQCRSSMRSIRIINTIFFQEIWFRINIYLCSHGEINKSRVDEVYRNLPFFFFSFLTLFFCRLPFRKYDELFAFSCFCWFKCWNENIFSIQLFSYDTRCANQNKIQQ